MHLHKHQLLLLLPKPYPIWQGVNCTFQFRSEGASQRIGIQHRIIKSIIEWLRLEKKQVVVRLSISCWGSYLILSAQICSSQLEVGRPLSSWHLLGCPSWTLKQRLPWGQIFCMWTPMKNRQRGKARRKLRCNRELFIHVQACREVQRFSIFLVVNISDHHKRGAEVQGFTSNSCLTDRS